MNTDKHRSKKETKAKEETTKHAKIAKVFSFLCHSRESGNPFFFLSFLFLFLVIPAKAGIHSFSFLFFVFTDY